MHCLNSAPQNLLAIKCILILWSEGARQELLTQHFPISVSNSILSVPPPNSWHIAKEIGKQVELEILLRKQRADFWVSLLTGSHTHVDASATSKISIPKVTQTSCRRSGAVCSVPLGRKLVLSPIMLVIIFLIWLLFDCSFGISEQMLKLYSWNALTAHSN